MTSPSSVTVSTARRADRTAYLESLLPAHVRERDADGLLAALLGGVAGELAAVEDDLARLYDSWFIETCPEWVVPYIADLVGLVGLPGDLGAESGDGVSRRAVVANTIAYRQRKGTVAVLEQVVRDVTGWPAKAVEFYRLLAATAHVNHVHTERPALASVRHAADVELESPRLDLGALTRAAHTGEVRRIAPGQTGGRGRYGIPNVGIFVFPLQVYDVDHAPARKTADGWATHPLGLDEPWFAVPTVEGTIEHLATEADLPVPLRPRRLLAALVAARAGQPDEPVPLAVTVEDGPSLDAGRIRVCGFEDLATDGVGGQLAGWQVMVDPVRGLLHPYRDGVPADPTAVHVDYAYGSVAEVGAGTYDRSLGHHDALAADPFTGDPNQDRDTVGAQVPVRLASSDPGIQASVVAAVSVVAAGWADPAKGLVGGTQVISVGDSETYQEDLQIGVPAMSRLVLVAANWLGHISPGGQWQAAVPGVYSPDGLRPRIVGDIVITGGTSADGTGDSTGGGSVLLDGLVVEGDVIVAPGSLGSLTISQCTVAGRIVVDADPDGANRELSVAVRRSLVGGIDLADTVPTLSVLDSVVDPALVAIDGGTPGPTLAGPGTHACIVGSTLFGEVGCRILEVTSSICDGVVTVVDRQRGCARFSYFGPGSRTPRRFRCVPPADAATAVAPAYLSSQPGSPFYPALAPSTATAIRTGGEFGAEMGVHFHLRRPLRMDAALRLVAPYVPAGMQIGMFGS